MTANARPMAVACMRPCTARSTRAPAGWSNQACSTLQGLVRQSLDVHEIKPVKFGGSPTDASNKVILPREVHRQQITTWWNKLLKDIGE
ncbi:hypothetical protein LHFGNBLO_004713 [Mesorhizobium sp. AR10]|uniref:hypothetical protein n=1 Tax=Mesorhizobium sp. AR10 TaxID=2865839 RepID=UPI00215E2E8C|nr:hypothetical protein [Mesorhizobium sp. AR10]UVK41771.1 hypothetical protein LHFGNBLO_004713 [Mesorhizobium sp. AR10]